MYFMVTPTFKHNAMAFYVYGKSYGNLVFQLVHVYACIFHALLSNCETHKFNLALNKRTI